MSLQLENYIVVPAFVVMPISEGGLGLKGNEAWVYAIIYGFSQDGESWFEGSQGYLADWCNSTTRGIRKNLEALIAKGLIEKREGSANGRLVYDYRVLRSSLYRNRVPTSAEQSSHHIIGDNNTPSDIDSNESISSPPKGSKVEEIVAYLNAKTGKHFLPTAKATQRKINARLKEGRTVEDFKQVIDTKTAEWQGTQWDKFLSPDTLFGEKFERYLNQTATEEEDAWGYPIYD